MESITSEVFTARSELGCVVESLLDEEFMSVCDRVHGAEVVSELGLRSCFACSELEKRGGR